MDEIIDYKGIIKTEQIRESIEERLRRNIKEEIDPIKERLIEDFKHQLIAAAAETSRRTIVELMSRVNIERFEDELVVQIRFTSEERERRESETLRGPGNP